MIHQLFKALRTEQLRLGRKLTFIEGFRFGCCFGFRLAEKKDQETTDKVVKEVRDVHMDKIRRL